MADITAEVQALPYAADFNPNVLSVAQDAAGNIYGVPIAAYGIGLHYNRQLFEEAGLDPDKPPTTWDEVRADAKAIADATGQAGYAQMTQNNTGGWMLTSLSDAFGGRLQTLNDDGSIDVTIDNPGTTKPRSSTCSRCAGTTTRWVPTSCSTGARSTRRSPGARSACT